MSDWANWHRVERESVARYVRRMLAGGPDGRS